ncbi:MAG TPA: hypothetical protein VGQ13_06020 [Nitrososphaera sp.]|jgi:Tol biopolymer transport system component|nr:hypothetical protein [Nitrososphaera sp.]
MASRTKVLIATGIAIGAALVVSLSVMLLSPSGLRIPNETSFQKDKVVVFAGIVNGTTAQIYTVNSDGTNLTNLTNEDDLSHFGPVASPDGSRIAYIVFNRFPITPSSNKTDESLYVVDADGSNKVLLANSSNLIIGRHIWSPDGTKIAYEADADIFVVNADGNSDTTNVINDGDRTTDFNPAWASNNKIIFESVVFDKDKRTFTASSFKQVDIHSGNASKLFDFDYNITGTHIWSPDLNKIAFLQANNESSPTSLYIMNGDGNNQTRLTTTGELLFLGGGLTWSPDSSKIAFGTLTGIYVIDISDGSNRNLSNSQTHDSNPVWSSDGQKIAFTRIISEEEAGIYVMNLDGSGQKQVAEIKRSNVNTPLDWLS